MQKMEYIVSFCHIFINYRVVKSYKGLKKRLYSQWISNEFGSCGKHCKFEGFRWLNEPKMMVSTQFRAIK